MILLSEFSKGFGVVVCDARVDEGFDIFFDELDLCLREWCVGFRTEILKKRDAVVWEIVGEGVVCRDVEYRGEDKVSKLLVVFLEDRDGDVVNVRVDGICCIVGDCGQSGVAVAWVACEGVLVKARERVDDGSSFDWI